MAWGWQSVVHIPDLQVGVGHPVPGGAGAVHHTEHPGIHRDGGVRKCF